MNGHPSPQRDSEVAADFTFLQAVAFEIGIGVLAIFAGYLTGIDPRATIPKLHQILLIAWGVGVGLLCSLPPIVVGIVAQTLPWKPFHRLRHSVERQLSLLFAKMHWSQWATLCLAAGVCEELLFRGWMQSFAATGIEGLAGVVMSIAISSLLFGICHFLSWTYFLIATLFGAYFGCCFYFTGNLLVPVVSHAVYDIAILGWMMSNHSKSEN